MVSHPNPRTKSKRRPCLLVVWFFLLLLILVFVVALILAFTVFKFKEPTTKLVSATLDGVASTLSFPDIQIHLNLTLDLTLNVHNPNHASFRHGQAKSVLYYRGKQVGETDIDAGRIPAKGSAALSCRLTLLVDKLASDVNSLVNDVLGGQVSLEASTQIPGKVSFLGFIKRHVTALSECKFTFGVPDMKIRSQTCKNKTKL